MAEPLENSMHNAHYLDEPTYLKSPVTTLVASLDDTTDDITLHDLLHAYSTLNNRLRSLAPHLSDSSATRPALKLISRVSDSIGRCLQRDIRRAIDDPLFPNSQTPTLMLQLRSILPQETMPWRECAMLCQYAIQTAVTFLRFPALSSLFSESVTSRLINDIMVVARCPDLPGMDSEKTCAVAMSLFSTIRVPPAIVALNGRKFLELLSDVAGCISPNNEGSKIVHHLLSTYPETFLSDAVEFLPDILSTIATADVPRRLDATMALSGFVLALVSTRSSSRHSAKDDIITTVRRFLRTQLPSGRPADNSSSLLLPYHLSRAIADDTNNRGSRWAITVICILIVLASDGVFHGTRSLGFVLKIVGHVANSKKQGSDELCACVWKCLVWAFSQFPCEQDPVAEDKPSETGRTSSTREAIFGIVKQELRGGVGACLVTTLLHSYHSRAQRDGNTSNPDKKWAMVVLKEMVTHRQGGVYQDGVAILSRLVSAVGTPASVIEEVANSTPAWTPNDMVVKALFSRHMLTVDVAAFMSQIHAANQFDPSAIQPLTEEEIQLHWNALSDIWVSCVRRELKREGFSTLPNGLLQVWQALLLVQTHLTQELGHLTATQEITDLTISTVSSFLEWSPSPSGESSLPATVVQSRVLFLCCQLWNVVRNVFSEAWLSQAAHSLLTRVVHHSFDTSSEAVKDAWSRLCAALVSASAPDLITRLVVADDEERIGQVRRQLWKLTAQSWTSRRPVPSWEESVDMLAMPVRDWTMNDADFEIWMKTFDDALHETSLPDSSIIVADYFVERALGGVENTTLHDFKPLLHILSRLQIKGEVQSHSAFLRLLNQVLCDLHADSSVDIGVAMELLRHTGNIVRECSKNSVVIVLSILAHGIAGWTDDSEEVLSDKDYNDIVVPLYCSALDALQDIPLTRDTLHALAHFFYSAFLRIPPPASAPLAFCKFWSDIQPSLSLSSSDYPEDLKTALQACHDAFGLELPDEISLDTESQFDMPSMPLTSPGTTNSPPTKRLDSDRAPDSSHSTPSMRHIRTVLGSASPSTPSWSTRSPAFSSPQPQVSLGASSATPGSVLGKDGASRSSLHPSVPSSPSDAMLARRRLAQRSVSRVSHESASRTPERPLKRRKISTQVEHGDVESSHASMPPSSPRPAKRRRTGTAASSASNASRRSGAWAVDSVEVRTPGRGDQQHGPYSRAKTPTPKSASSEGRITEEEVLASPEVPTPTTAARMMPSSPDDYNSWEVPIHVDEGEVGEEDEVDADADIVVPDSQPAWEDGEDDEDDSLVPSFMKSPAPQRKSKGKGKERATDLSMYADADTAFLGPLSLSPSSSSHPPEHPHTTARASPLRMHTAPASLHLEPSLPSIADTAAPLRRARTGTDSGREGSSGHIDGLRAALGRVEEEGSQLALEEMLAMAAETNRFHAMLTEKMERKLRERGRRGK